MIKRWLIRSLFILLLAVCVTAWVGSAFFYLNVARSSPVQRTSLYLGGGEIGWDHDAGMGAELEHLRDEVSGRLPLTGHGPWWSCDCGRYQGPFRWVDQYPGGYHLGAVAIYILPPPLSDMRMTMPLWFPTLLFVLLLAIVWRKTRLNKGGRAFPVEPAAKSGAT